MRVTCIGEGHQMKRTIPLLALHGFDVSYFTRSKAISDNLLQPSILPTALPQSLHESACILLFLNNASYKKYALSRDAHAAMANKSVITIYDEFDALTELQSCLSNLRADCFSIHQAGSLTSVNARPDQKTTWAKVIEAIQCQYPTVSAEQFKNENVITGPWARDFYTLFNTLPSPRKQPMN